MVPWCHGATVPWCHGAMLPWCHGATVLWSHGALMPRCLGATVPWHHGSALPRARGAWEASICPAMTARPVIEARCEGTTRCVTPKQTCPRPNGFGRNMRSKTRWFTGFCNSHQVSHFTMFFIDVRAEISVAESCFRL
ncbi:hypothetical protein CQW23_33682 [Capsicum baccatum]|uniref:Secreted protein n=1 Tax=Capsicum baccatum TaxID=33114 RepID=A0A2G2V148_CAPBA|nr:hypothetical protein CQW23_33682 [Capsicum baccatum]